MSKIPVNELISCFERMRDEHWDYCLNSAREGCVDCSGAFVWAYKQFGNSVVVPLMANVAKLVVAKIEQLEE